MKNQSVTARCLLAASLALAGLAGSPGARADEVTDWNQNMFTAVFTAKTTALFTTRVTALVQSAVFVDGEVRAQGVSSVRRTGTRSCS